MLESSEASTLPASWLSSLPASKLEANCLTPESAYGGTPETPSAVLFKELDSTINISRLLSHFWKHNLVIRFTVERSATWKTWFLKKDCWESIERRIKKEAAVKLLFDLISRHARANYLAKAEALREKLFEGDLPDICASGISFVMNTSPNQIY